MNELLFFPLARLIFAFSSTAITPLLQTTEKFLQGDVDLSLNCANTHTERMNHRGKVPPLWTTVGHYLRKNRSMVGMEGQIQFLIWFEPCCELQSDGCRFKK